MSTELLATLFEDHRYLARGVSPLHAAIAVVPELAEGVPPLVADVGGLRTWSACGESLRPLVEAVVTEATYTGNADGLDALEARLAIDPLVNTVSTLAREGLAVSRGACTVPFLQVMSFAAEMTQANGGSTLSPEILGRISTAILVRLGAACARLDALGLRVPAMVEALTTARLSPIFPRGTLDRDLDLSFLCDVVGSAAPAPLVRAGADAITRIVEGVVERRNSGSSLPGDQRLLLRMLPPAVLDEGPAAAAGSLLYDPDAWAILLPTLRDWLDSAALVEMGVREDLAERVLEPSVGVAVAAAVGEALIELRRWDVLSMLGASLAPPPEGLRSLLTPRGTPGWGTVVACGLGRIRGDTVLGGLDTNAVAAIDAAWRALLVNLSAGVADLGHAGLVVFEDTVEALRFALALEDRLGTRIAVGVGQGFLLGGTDGVDARFYGGGVDAALRWLAVAPLPEELRVDGTSVLAHVGGWLCGVGVGIDAACVQALEATLAKRVQSPEVMRVAAGSRVPRGLDVWKVLPVDDRSVIALVRIPGVSGGYEVLRFTTQQWTALVEADGEERLRERSSVGARPSQPRSIHPLVAAGEPMQDFEMVALEGLLSELPGEAEDEGDLPTALQPLFFLPGARAAETAVVLETDEDEGWDMPDRSSAAVRPSHPSHPVVDARYLLQGYATLHHDGQVWFGRPAAGRFVDLHTYAFQGDLDTVYGAFLRDKVDTGFTPRLERSAQVPSGANTAPLDMDRLGAAWRRVAGDSTAHPASFPR
jgi:hypothetical protein